MVSSNRSSRPVQLPLSRRLLFPNLPLDSPYPLLFSSQELDSEFYDFIALSLRAYVTPWWSKLSRYDKDLLPEINRILIHILQALEVRLHNTDLSLILLRDFPVILTQHYRDYRNAASKLSSSYANGGSYSIHHLFHQSQPHMALSPDGSIKEDYYRQVLDHLLRVLLPPEDYTAVAERFIIREAILKVVLVDLLPRVTQPWFIQLVILNQLSSQDQINSYISPKKSSPNSTSHSFLIMLLSTVQKLSGVSLAIVHAYKQAVSAIKSVNQLPIHKVPSLSQVTSPDQTVTESSASENNSPDSVSTPDERLRRTEVPSSPATLLPLFILFSEIFNTTERLASLIITTILFVMTVLWTSFLDRLVPHLLTTHLSSAFVLNATHLAKRTLFPNGYPGPSYEDPTPEEQAAIRTRLAASRPTGILAYLVPIVLGSNPTATLDAAIEPLCNSKCNLHLAIVILDRILVGLFPELVHPEGNSFPFPLGDSQQEMTSRQFAVFIPPSTDAHKPSQPNINTYERRRSE